MRLAHPKRSSEGTIESRTLIENKWIQTKLEGEVAILSLLASKTTIQVPKVFAHSKEGEGNSLGVPWMIMEFCSGSSLWEIYGLLDEKQRVCVQ
jgi:aminoglycoside phosphotransferase (APT) family kinase protein